MKNDCKKIQNDLVAYLDHELAEEKSLLVTEHVASCASCQKEVSDLKEAMNILAVWEAITPSKNYDQRFWQKITVFKKQQAGKTDIISVLRSLILQHRTLSASFTLAALLVMLTLFQAKPAQELTAQKSLMLMNQELFLNLNVIENSDALENFEVIAVLDRLLQDEKQ